MTVQTASYRILDEPQPGALAKHAVNPTWPFLALMLVGGWLAWPWFVFNSFALGSNGKKRELAWVVGGVTGIVALIATLIAFRLAVDGSKPWIPYLRLIPIVWKLLIAYVVFLSQQRSFEILETYSDGTGEGSRIGAAPLLIGMFVGRRLLNAIRTAMGGEDSLAWIFVWAVLQ